MVKNSGLLTPPPLILRLAKLLLSTTVRVLGTALPSPENIISIKKEEFSFSELLNTVTRPSLTRLMATVQVTDMTTQTILRHAATMVTETTVTVATETTVTVEE